MCNKWASIETAPKDGSYILAIWAGWGDGPDCGSQSHAIIQWDCGRWIDDHAELTPMPTHWQPLPEPPETL